MSIHLSVVIITFNEEQNIGRCLQSVQDLADEVVVLDSYSTDRTKDICLQYHASFYEHAFAGHIEQKNRAITYASYDHVLSLDADEALTPELYRSIEKVKANWQYDGYVLSRLTNYCGQWIRYCGWYPDRKLRLFDRRKGSWTGQNPHDRYEVQGSTHNLQGDLLHYSYHSISQHMKQIDFFTDISSQVAFEKGKTANLLGIWVRSNFKFFRDYILKLGFLDGYYGYVVCKNAAHAKFLKYVKLKELWKDKK